MVTYSQGYKLKRVSRGYHLFLSGKNLTKEKNLKLLNVWNKKEPLSETLWYGEKRLEAEHHI